MSGFKMRCPVCGDSCFLLGPEIFDDRYGEPNGYHLARCEKCDHLATAPRLRESELPSLYGNYYPRKDIRPEDVVNEAAKVNWRYAGLLRWLSGTDNQGQYIVHPGETMLDVGCGSGTSLLEAKELGATAFGIEADPNVKPIASSLGLNIHFGSLGDRPFPDQAFDLIVMNQVIEHLPDPDEALCGLSERLTRNGRIVLVFPNINSLSRRVFGLRWINWHIPYHLHHFDRKHFERMARRCGLRVVRSRTITPNLWTVLQLRAVRQQSKRGQPSSIWKVTACPENELAYEGKSRRLRNVFRLSILPIIATFNRIIDLTGMGDSLLVELRAERRR